MKYHRYTHMLSSFLMRAFLLAIIYMLLTVMTGYAQEVSIKVKKAPLEQVLNDLRKQSGYAFLFREEYLKKALPVTLEVQKTEILKVLPIIFRDQPFDYEINKKIITIIPRIEPIKRINSNEQQKYPVRGQVTDSTGMPITGVTVRIKETNTVFATDKEGYYQIADISPGNTLIFSMVGYNSSEAKVVRPEINVRLSKALNRLDETVVIAYGTTTRRLNTGSVVKVSAAELETQPISNPINMLQGRVPGLFITQKSGLPGSNLSVMIRGQNSIQQGNAPLYLIDGVPFGGEEMAQNTLIYANSPFNSINPADIESIEVLKDADATAIYGSRGANGVILITTKRAKATRTQLDVQMYQGWGNITRSPKFMNTSQYLEMRREAFKNDGKTPTLSSAYDIMAWDTTRYTDWSKVLIGNTSHTTNMQARLEGGNASTKFSWNNGFYRESTVYPTDNDLKRYTTSFTANHISADKRFSVNLNAAYSNQDSRLPRSNLASAINRSPNAPDLYKSNGDLNFEENGFSTSNPIARLREPYEAKTDQLTLHANPSYKITGDLSAKIDAGYNFMHYDEYSAVPIAAQNPANKPEGTANFGQSALKSFIIEPQLSYKKKFEAEHNLEILIGGTWQSSNLDKSNISAIGYTNDDFIRSSASSSARSVTTTNGIEQYRYQATFARATYSFRNRYILNATARRDGSSRFGPENQYANFGAIGAAWIFSDEHFTKSLPWLSYGKIRASYGLTGNDQIGNYQFLDSWSSTVRPYLNQLSLEPSRLANPFYAWETNRKLDLAIELGALDSRILLNIDYYRNVSGNQLIYYSLPTQTGFYNILRNFPGKVENKGWEFQLNTENIRSQHLSWKSSFNLTIPQNKLLEFPDLENSSFASSYVIGEPLSVVKGYRYLGIDPEKGIYTFEDKDGNGTLNSLDRYVVGNTAPALYGGLLNTISWKGLQLDFLFQFTKRQARHRYYSMSGAVGNMANQPIELLDRWQPGNTDAKYQKYSQQRGEVSTAAANMSTSDAAYTDGSFIRLKNVSISYSLPENIIKRIKARQLRIYAQAQNLITITDYAGDPETANYLELPPVRIITLGTQISF